MARGTRQRMLAIVVAACLVATAAPAHGQAAARAQAPPPVAPLALDLSHALETTARNVAPSVVQIFTTSYAPGSGPVARPADLITTQRASGSGVIVDPDGYIVTNAHVVKGASRLRVEVSLPAGGDSILAVGSRLVGGQVVAIDEETDLAVIKIAERNLPAIEFGDSDALKPGQIVLALGSPLGLHNTVSMGVVSAIARQLEPESPMIYVQTDAAIKPGSSGGPLVDLHGRLVGINTLILAQSAGDQGPAFAAPGNIVRTVFEQIRKTGYVRRGEIGVRAQTVTPVLAAGLGLPRNHGVILADVMPGSPAARAGLRPGDVVLALDGKRMENGRQFHVNVYRHQVGEFVALEVMRSDQTLNVRVPVVNREDPLINLAESIDPRANLVPRLGILGLTVDQRIAALLPPQRLPAGVVVVSTAPGAFDSREGGLAPGDVIHAVNRMLVAGLPELRTLMDALPVGSPVVIQLERQGMLMYLPFTVE
jgi:serine protease Do